MHRNILTGKSPKAEGWAKSLLCLSLVAGVAHSQTAATNPAARTHVKQVGTGYFKFTSKLTKIVELNFTFGNGHQPGKAIIATGLDRIATTYGGITVQHIKQGTDGATGTQPNFTVDDLLSGQVIVANNVSMFGSTSMGTAKQQAIQKAIETDGRGYLGFHGSGDNEQAGWAWFTNTLHPMNYRGHGARVNAPVYKHLAEAKHIILQGILETRTTTASVPNEKDAGGAEVIAANVPVRQMKNEWYKFGRQIADDPLYKDKVTILLKYDPRNLGSALETQYRRTGGNMFTYLYKVGAGLTSYMPPGHENDELLDANTGFDGGSGDYDRYVAQTLFFLAGYTSTPCDNSCRGLPVVDATNRLTGTTYDPTLIKNPKAVFAANEIHFDAKKPTFSSPFDGKYEAKLLDTRGRVLESKRGEGSVYHEFNTSGLQSGVYVLSVKIGAQPARIKRYLL